MFRGRLTSWRKHTTLPKLEAYNKALRMITQEERALIPLVAKHGCLDLRALRKAWQIVKLQPNEAVRKHLFVYYYTREADPDKDEPMFDDPDLQTK